MGNPSEPAEQTPAATIEPATPAEVAAYASQDSVDRIEKMVAQLQVPGAVTEPHREFASTKDFVLTLADAAKGSAAAAARIEKYALADDTTTTAAGVVPDYQSQDVISILDEERPFIQSVPSDPIGDHGMAVVYPEVKVKPTVDVQSAEKTEVDSTAMDIDPKSVPLTTIAGASDVSRQLIERSQPSFVDMLFREYASAYAQKTEATAVAAGVAGAGGTAVLADLGASAAATWAAFNAANAAIVTAVRRPATHVALGSTRWTQLNSLVDSDGRPLLVFPDNGPNNAQGQSGFATMSGQYGGLVAYLDPDAAATACLIYNKDRFAAVLESEPVQLRAEVVSLLGFEMGVYGLFATAIKYAGGGYTLTAS